MGKTGIKVKRTSRLYLCAAVGQSCKEESTAQCFFLNKQAAKKLLLIICLSIRSRIMYVQKTSNLAYYDRAQTC